MSVSSEDIAMVQHWVSQWGYPGIVLIMFFESAPVVGLFLPGIFIAIALGGLTTSDTLPFLSTWLLASLGAFLGDSVGYVLGRWLSEERRHHLHATRFSGKRKQASAYLDRFGARGVAIGRFVWFVHPTVPPLAGIAGITPARFFLYDTPALLLWMALYMGMGHWFTGIWLDRQLEGMEITSLIVLAIALAVMLFRHYRKSGR